MSTRARLLLFGVAGSGLLAVLLIGFGRLPDFGDFHGVVGLSVDRVELGARHATDYVTAVNFDIRAFDTLGEEFILFASVTGAALLFRHIREEEGRERARGSGGQRFQGASEALQATSLVLVTVLTALGIYVVLHGALTPGGGFQGGVVLAAGPLAVALCGRYLTVRRVAPDWALEALESLGAGAYTLIGLGGLIFGGVFLKNFLPYGTPDMLLSAGTMPLNSIAVGLEVTGGLLLIFSEFLDQAVISTRGETA